MASLAPHPACCLMETMNKRLVTPSAQFIVDPDFDPEENTITVLGFRRKAEF